MKKLLLSAMFALLAAPAMAQPPLKLDIRDGVVNLDATAVPARQILAEWARIGGTKVVGSEKIPGSPLTLKLENVPESQALDIILRNVAGYMAAPRRAAAEAGASGFDRIVILPTTSTPPPATNANARTPSRFGPRGGTQRGIPPRPGMPDPDDDDPVAFQQDPADEPEDGAYQQPPVFSFPQPQPAPDNTNNVFVPVQQGGFGVPQQGGFAVPPQGVFGVPMQPGAQPQITLQPGAGGQPTIYNFVPQGTQPPPQGGFGVVGAPAPGMVQQPAPMPGQQVPAPRKPPGGR
jgi:hypothetical protein